MIQDFFAPVIYNVTTPSSAGAAGATTFARPPNGSFIQSLILPVDPPSEIVNDAEWITVTG